MARLTAALLPLIALVLAACDDGGGGGSTADPTRAPATGDAGQQATALPGGASFEDVVLASEINAETKEPITRVRAFRSNDEAMHAAIKAKNVPAGSQIIFRWTKGTAVVGTITVPVPEAIDESWIAASVRPSGPIPAGDDWLLAVAYNGVPVGSVTFSVQ